MPATTSQLHLGDVPVADTFAEAFPITATRLIVTAATQDWARTAVQLMCGHATSVIACDAEAALERIWTPNETPDGRPGASALVCSFGRTRLAEAVASRVGQCVLTCPTTAVFNGLQVDNREDRIAVGKQLRFFGDGFQSSKRIGGRRLWRIPVMDGEFLCEDLSGTVKGVAGGNLLICGTSQAATLAAAESAVAAMRDVQDIILPFPGGIVRSGSKVGSRYKTLKASTNDAYCPTIRPRTEPDIPAGTNAVYEIVIDGLSFESVQQAMKTGLHAAASCDGLTLITAGNYGGKLGPHHFALKDLL